ncbi:MAG: hypothetical protein AMXMBFR84_43540, partial [Candidatus Hydrogenedentota bacterium]
MKLYRAYFAVLCAVTAWGVLAYAVSDVDDGSSGLSLPIVLALSFGLPGLSIVAGLKWLVADHVSFRNADIAVAYFISWCLYTGILAAGVAKVEGVGRPGQPVGRPGAAGPQ